MLEFRPSLKKKNILIPSLMLKMKNIHYKINGMKNGQKFLKRQHLNFENFRGDKNIYYPLLNYHILTYFYRNINIWDMI